MKRVHTATTTPAIPADVLALKRVVFDHNVPARLARLLKAFDVKLARDLGWQQLSNGKLFEAVEENGFDILLTGRLSPFLMKQTHGGS